MPERQVIVEFQLCGAGPIISGLAIQWLCYYGGSVELDVLLGEADGGVGGFPTSSQV
jgi:hypothetical protein